MLDSVLPPLYILTTFISISFFLAVVPGPAVVYILTRVIADGKCAGLASVSGVALGNFFNMLGSILGLSILFSLSSIAFTSVKIAGALYLFYLGIMALKHRPAENNHPHLKSTAYKKIFIDGFLVALLNPKTALFFAAFLPQFIDIEQQFIALQSVILGVFFVCIAAAVDVFYVFSANVLLPLLSQKTRRFKISGRYIIASCYFFLAGFAAFSKT
ncbi:MAG: LysE family translocator [Cellvibrionaceae bacterium]|nr:LysE family translocator [Cellvibrionaceae bacterium]